MKHEESSILYPFMFDSDTFTVSVAVCVLISQHPATMSFNKERSEDCLVQNREMKSANM